MVQEGNNEQEAKNQANHLEITEKFVCKWKEGGETKFQVYSRFELEPYRRKS